MNISNTNDNNNSKILSSRNERFVRNKRLINSNKGFKINLPNFKNFKPHLKEIFELIRANLKAEDVKALLDGTLNSESFINLYFKILEKINLVLLSA